MLSNRRLSTIKRLPRAVLARFFGRRRLRFPYLGSPLSEREYSELGAEQGWAKASLAVAPGISLRGLVRRPSDPRAPWVLYYPGNDRTQLRTGQRVLMQLAAERDWGLAVFAYRGYDSSDGRFQHDDLAADAPEILNSFCAVHGLSTQQVHLVGFSIGGYFASAAAARAAQAERPAASLTLLAGVYDIVMVRPSPWHKLSPGDDYQTRPLLAPVPAPALILQGAADEALQGATQARQIARELGQRAGYEEFEGVGHEAIIFHEPALRKARDFIAASIK